MSCLQFVSKVYLVVNKFEIAGSFSWLYLIEHNISDWENIHSIDLEAEKEYSAKSGLSL